MYTHLKSPQGVEVQEGAGGCTEGVAFGRVQVMLVFRWLSIGGMAIDCERFGVDY